MVYKRMIKKNNGKKKLMKGCEFPEAALGRQTFGMNETFQKYVFFLLLMMMLFFSS